MPGRADFRRRTLDSRLKAAYTRGAGIILAADLHEMIAGVADHGREERQGRRVHGAVWHRRSALPDRRTSRSNKETTENHLNLQFAGNRQRVASWLGAPAAVGSLDFVSPNAALAVAGVSKDPASIVDDLVAMMSTDERGT